MSMKNSTVGLCLTCNNAAGCVYRKRRGVDAIHCETFDDYVPLNGKGKKETQVVMVEPTAELTNLKGLCLNCTHRDVCHLSRPETGVWHCEEFE